MSNRAEINILGLGLHIRLQKITLIQSAISDQLRVIIHQEIIIQAVGKNDKTGNQQQYP